VYVQLDGLFCKGSHSVCVVHPTLIKSCYVLRVICKLRNWKLFLW